MAIARWNPFQELEDVTNRLNRMYQPRGNDHGGLTGFDWAPVVDVRETPEAFLIKAELPGVNKEDVHVEIKDGVLTLRGERHLEKEEKGEKMHRVERSYGSFMRSFTVQAPIREAETTAEYKDGILTVKLMKATEPPMRSHKVKIG